MDIKIDASIEPKGEGKKRFSAQEKLLILSEITKDRSIEDVAEDYTLAVGTLKRWQKRKDESKSKEDPLGLGGLGDESTSPKRPGNRLSQAKEKEILKCWQDSPGLGPSQLQYQLRREGLRVSTKAIRRILIENGYEKKKRIGTGELQRFEAERPNKLWQLDILEFYLGKLKVYVLLMIDDYSRFVVGYGIFTDATMGHAISVLRKAIARYGKPEALLTDRGMQFYSWRTMNRFQKLLEALNKRIQNELIQKNHFKSLSELEASVRAWIYGYNHNRTHQGIKDPELGSILVPADRYFGRVDEVLAKVRARLDGKQPSPFDYTKDIENLNPFEIFKVMENKGSLEVWFCGKSYRLLCD